MVGRQFAAGGVVGCRPGAEGVCVEGSDTMVNLAQGWAENYHATYPEAMIQISGGGSGVGIASLIDGNCEIASASRKMKDKEIEQVREKRHREPKEFIVGFDALAIYVHKDNPLDSISIEELAEIYGEGGKITRWSQMGVDPERLGNDTIIRVSRQNSSGTYDYFREAVMGKNRDYKLGSIDQNGSVDVVALVANTPSAIGYSGMGYADAGGEDAEDFQAQGRARRCADGRERQAARRRLSDHPAAAALHRRRTEGQGKAVPRLDPGQAGPESRRGTGIRARRQL